MLHADYAPWYVYWVLAISTTFISNYIVTCHSFSLAGFSPHAASPDHREVKPAIFPHVTLSMTTQRIRFFILPCLRSIMVRAIVEIL